MGDSDAKTTKRTPRRSRHSFLRFLVFFAASFGFPVESGMGSARASRAAVGALADSRKDRERSAQKAQFEAATDCTDDTDGKKRMA
jgi:hypothetical protein